MRRCQFGIWKSALPGCSARFMAICRMCHSERYSAKNLAGTSVEPDPSRSTAQDDKGKTRVRHKCESDPSPSAIAFSPARPFSFPQGDACVAPCCSPRCACSAPGSAGGYVHHQGARIILVSSERNGHRGWMYPPAEPGAEKD